MERNPIYSDSNVTITNHLAKIFGVSYPVRAISSIKIGQRKKAATIFPRVLLILIGSTLACLGLIICLNLFGETDSHSLWMGLGIAGISAPLGVLMIVSAVLYKVPPPEFDLILVTNAREGVVMTDKDPDYIQHIRAAIEQAIIGTGQSALGRE